MANESTLGFVGIAPHPPIMVPEVGHDASDEVRASIEGMAELTQRIIDCKAETIVLISPHAPLEPSAFVAYDGPDLYGDFAKFRAPTATAQAKLDDELLTEITRTAADQNLVVLRVRDQQLDHGTAVPLYFLQRNGWHGKVVALGYSFLSNEEHLRFGNCVRTAISRLGRRTAFVASGDLSHRLKPDAPAGFDPQAHRFDEEVVAAVRTGATDRIINIDQELRRVAGECGYRSMLVALGVMQSPAASTEVISYEAPFGVGYMVAQLMSERVVAGGPNSLAKRAMDEPAHSMDADQPHATAGGSDIFPALARLTIETFVNLGTVIDAPTNLAKGLHARAACFVSIKTRAGDLRGCIGTIDPDQDSLAEEIIANAINAASRDPRFPPVLKEELPSLKYSVDVLSAPEPSRLEGLDPEIYGVIVEDEEGRRGVLLPRLESIQTAEQQVEIAARKAGISPGKPLIISRFRADRYSE